MNIIEAIKDENLFRSFLGDDLQSWRQWMTFLRAVYGLPITKNVSRKLIQECTGRNPDSLPDSGFETVLTLTGRRSGKSRIAALIGAYEAVLAGHHTKLAPGEDGVVAICSPTKKQSNNVKNYLRAIFDTPLLQREVIRKTTESFELRNGVVIRILAGDYRTVRGFTLLAAIVDEACFFGLEAESKVKSDAELIAALEPGLVTIRGKLVCISSPYARKGWCFKTWERDHGNDAGRVLVWNCPSMTMNPTLDAEHVKQKVNEDPAKGRSEWLGQWRDDVAEYLPRQAIESLVKKGRTELLPRPHLRYVGFADLSGGRADDAALSIAHRDQNSVIIDLARRWKPPLNPQSVIAEMSDILKQYGLKRVTGDNYAAEFVAAAFVACGIQYSKCEQNKSQLYLELLPRLGSGQMELPDNETLIDQLASLERRTRSGGRDIIDHPSGGHDDLANAVAGVAVVAVKKTRRVGAL